MSSLRPLTKRALGILRIGPGIGLAMLMHFGGGLQNGPIWWGLGLLLLAWRGSSAAVPVDRVEAALAGSVAIVVLAWVSIPPTVVAVALVAAAAVCGRYADRVRTTGMRAILPKFARLGGSLRELLSSPRRDGRDYRVAAARVRDSLDRHTRRASLPAAWAEIFFSPVVSMSAVVLAGRVGSVDVPDSATCALLAAVLIRSAEIAFRPPRAAGDPIGKVDSVRDAVVRLRRLVGRGPAVRHGFIFVMFTAVMHGSALTLTASAATSPPAPVPLAVVAVSGFAGAMWAASRAAQRSGVSALSQLHQHIGARVAGGSEQFSPHEQERVVVLAERGAVTISGLAVHVLRPLVLIWVVPIVVVVGQGSLEALAATSVVVAVPLTRLILRRGTVRSRRFAQVGVLVGGAGAVGCGSLWLAGVTAGPTVLAAVLVAVGVGDLRAPADAARREMHVGLGASDKAFGLLEHRTTA